MNSAKTFLERAFDFAIFVAACFVIVGGMARVAMMQDLLHHSLSDKGMNTVMTEDVMRISADELFAQFCYPCEISSVSVDGNLCVGGYKDLTAYVASETEYYVSRSLDADGRVIMEIFSISEEEEE